MPLLNFRKILLFILCITDVVVWGQDTLSANTVIQNAIQAAPRHEKQFSNYKANIFIQNVGEWTRIPAIWKGLLRKEGVEEGVKYQSESYLNFSADTAHNYLSNYLAIRNNFHIHPRPDKFVNPNFYSPVLGIGAISPLYPQAFHFYHFETIAKQTIEEQTIYQIKVTPRHNNDEKVFKGIISIDAKSFEIQQIDLQVINNAIVYQIKIEFSFINKDWLPTKYLVKVSGDVMGFQGKYQYLAQVSDYHFFDNQSIIQIHRPTKKEFKEIYNWQERNFEVQQFKQVINALGVSLKNRWSDANTASGLERFEQIYIDEKADNQPDSFWESLNNDNPKVAYYPNLAINVRTKNALPPQPEEYITFRQANNKFGVGSVLFSRSFFWGDSSAGYFPHEFYYKSPVLDFNFNTVEGFVFNTGLLYRKRSARYDYIEIDPTWRYSFGLKKSVGTLKIRWKTQQDDISVMGGSSISQYNVDTPIAYDLNSLSTLLLKKNFVKIYEKDFITFSFIERFNNKWAMRTSIEFANRSPLNNTTSYSWIDILGADYTSNFPQNSEIGKTNFEANRAFLLNFQLNYRPFLKAQYRNTLSFVDLSSSPLIVFKYRGAVPNKFFKSEIEFHTIELGITHNFPISINTTFNYIAQAGTFLNTNNMTFADFKHFNGNTNLISVGEALTTHRLVGFYENYVWGASKKLIDHYYYSTNGSYIDVMTMMGFRKFALTQFVPLRRLGIREELFANFLHTGNQNVRYAEVGYGIDGIARIFRVEAAFSFVNENFSQFGIRISLNSRVRGGVTPEW